MLNQIKIGTRGSLLALSQTEIIVKKILAAWPNIKISVVAIKTSGDTNLLPFPKSNNNKGMFTFEIERALMNHEIDLAVHSLKDLPVNINSELPIIAYSKRGSKDPFDVLVGCEGVIGSSSLRRKLQIEKLYPASKVLPVRGNVNTRIKKLNNGEFDGLVLAYAGLERLGLQNRITKIFNENEIMPAPGQGILVCQGRRNENYFYLDSVNDKDTELCAKAERSFSWALNAGCNIPVGGYAKIYDDDLILKGLYIDEKCKKFYHGEISGNKFDAEKLGAKLAKEIFL